MLNINATIAIQEGDFQWSFVRASGPGGQNVNKVASKAVLKWNVVQSPDLPVAVKERFQKQQHRRINDLGEIVLTSQRYRDQERNRQDCLEKLRHMIQKATEVPRPRKKTRPTRASKERRLQAKKQRGKTKQMRKLPGEE